MVISAKDAVLKAFEDSVQVKKSFLKENLGTLLTVIDVIVQAFLQGNKLLLFGNGGSAADAQHLAAEFVNRFRIERPPLPALALTTDTSTITSIANDYDYKEIFAKQVKALGKEGDVALAISTSGNSANVLTAIDACRKLKIITIGLTGAEGGKMSRRVDHLLRVSKGKNTARIQETHILIGHVICEMVDLKIFSA